MTDENEKPCPNCERNVPVGWHHDIRDNGKCGAGITRDGYSITFGNKNESAEEEKPAKDYSKDGQEEADYDKRQADRAKKIKNILSNMQFARNMAIHKSYNDIADHIARTGKQMMFKDGTSGTAAEAPDGSGRLIAMDSKRIPKLKF